MTQGILCITSFLSFFVYFSLLISADNESEIHLFIFCNRYDHLAAIIRKILDERPKNVADYFEEFSRRIRKERFQIDAENITSFYRQPIILPISKLICANLKVDFMDEQFREKST